MLYCSNPKLWERTVLPLLSLLLQREAALLARCSCITRQQQETSTPGWTHSIEQMFSPFWILIYFCLRERMEPLVKTSAPCTQQRNFLSESTVVNCGYVWGEKGQRHHLPPWLKASLFYLSNKYLLRTYSEKILS